MKEKRDGEFVSLAGSDLLAKKDLEHRLEALRKLADNMSTQIDDLGRLEWLRGTHSEDISFYAAVQRFEISLINEALGRTQGHQRRAARMLGLNHTTLNTMIKRYNIQHASWNQRGDGSTTLNHRQDNYVF